MITTYHNISFGTQTVPEQIPVVQGDTGREIVFILTDFTIPEGATATYYVQKPSGEAVYNTATISENNIIVALTAQSIIEVGENDLQVRVILDDDIVTSFRAILMVRPFLGIGAVESSTEINIFDQAVEDAKEEINATIESAETALDEAIEEAIIEVHENALAFYVTDEASGAIATFPDGADLVPVKSLTVEIEPVQDLHGQSAPYPAGGSANKLPQMVDGTYEGNGVKAVVKNGVATLSGTTTSTGNALIIPLSAEYIVQGGEYLHFLNSVAMGSVAPSFEDANSTSDATAYSFSSVDRIVTVSSQAGYKFNRIRFYIANGVSLSGTFSPMIMDTDTVTPWTPYANICPITGWSQAKVTRTGKNLLDPNILTVFGATYVSSIDYATEGKVPVKPSTQYVLSFSGSVGDGRILQYDASGNLIGNAISFTSQPYYFTTDARCVSIGFRYKFTETSGATVADSKAQMELGSTASDYEPYNGHTYTIDLSGTRYGGTLDVTSGVLTVTHGYVDMGTLTWNYDTNNTRFFANVSGGKIYAGTSGQTTSLCSQYAYSALSDFASKDKVFCTGSGSVSMSACYVAIKDTAYSDKDTFKTAMNGVQLVYELATPQTVQLTAEEVTTLLGQNNIFADCGDVSCEYRADTKKYIDKILNA